MKIFTSWHQFTLSILKHRCEIKLKKLKQESYCTEVAIAESLMNSGQYKKAFKILRKIQNAES